MDLKTIKTLMCEVPHFDGLDSAELEILAPLMELKRVEKGTMVVKESASGDSLYYIVDGQIEIRKEALDGRQTVLARFKKGSTIGEMSIIEKNAPRSASAMALVDSDLLVLTRKNFDVLVEDHPRVALKIMQTIASLIGARLRHTSGRFADIFE